MCLVWLFLAFFNGNEPVLFPDITYSFYEVWAELFNVKTKISNLDENMRLVKEDFLKNEKLGGIVIANPNAPTGLCEPVAFIKEVALAHPECLLIVDEAYVDFGGESAVSLVNELPNLLVAQTFSKSRSLAGLRIGYAVGNEELVAALEAVRYSYNSYTMNMPVQLMGSAILADEEYFNLTVKKIVNERERTKKRLKDLGFSFPDSKTNFIFVKHEKLSGEYIFNELKKRKIYVRHFKADKIKEYNRITIGTPEQMDKLIDALVEIVAV
jgi:histidinol-phosphate aminotransferase